SGGRGAWSHSPQKAPPKKPGPAVLPPSPAAIAEYFRRRRSSISEFSPDDIRHNERLWVIEICGLDESFRDPAPIITREQAARLDDPFTDKRTFGPHGQYTKCAGCGAVFESLGLKLCAGCSKSSHAPETKRCRECGAPLPPMGPSNSAPRHVGRKPIGEGALLRLLRGLMRPDVVTHSPFAVRVVGESPGPPGRMRNSAP